MKKITIEWNSNIKKVIPEQYDSTRKEIKKNNLEGFSKEFLISSAKNNFNKDINFRKYLSLYNKIFKDWDENFNYYYLFK